MKVVTVLLMILLGGCAAKAPPAVTAIAAKRLLCSTIDRVTYAYDPTNPAASDTRQTIGQIRKNNAARAKVCGQREVGK